MKKLCLIIFGVLFSTTTVSAVAQDVNLLEDIKAELKTINSTLNTLANKIESRYSTPIFTESTPSIASTTAPSSVSTATTASTTATSESTATTEDPPLGDRQTIIETLAQEETVTKVCTPLSKDDLCSELIGVLNNIENVTGELNQGKLDQSHLDKLKSSSATLNDTISKADKEPINGLNLEAFKSETKRIQGEVTKAITKVEELISSEGGVALVAVIGVLGGLIFLSLLGLGVYVGKQRNQLMKKEQIRRMNETRISTDSSAEEGNVNKGFVEEKFPKVGVPSRFHDAPSRTPYASRKENLDDAPSRFPYASRKENLDDAPSRFPYASRKENLRREPSWPDSLDRQSDRRPHALPRTDYEDDPFSLERRNANMKRAMSGGLRRYDP